MDFAKELRISHAIGRWENLMKQQIEKKDAETQTDSIDEQHENQMTTSSATSVAILDQENPENDPTEAQKCIFCK
ncbi:hypothetical protein RDWZM_009872, partial [Blomia tropicalis]